jgi:DNA-binding transcriptional LysR family regulator
VEIEQRLGELRTPPIATATSSNARSSTEETTQTIQVPSRLAVNLGEAAVSAATAGAGIACTLSYLVDDLVKSGSLVKLLGAYESPPTSVSLIYPSQRQVPRKLRALLDFSVPRLRQRLGDNDT